MIHHFNSLWKPVFWILYILTNIFLLWQRPQSHLRRNWSPEQLKRGTQWPWRWSWPSLPRWSGWETASYWSPVKKLRSKLREQSIRWWLRTSPLQTGASTAVRALMTRPKPRLMWKVSWMISNSTNTLDKVWRWILISAIIITATVTPTCHGDTRTQPWAWPPVKWLRGGGNKGSKQRTAGWFLLPPSHPTSFQLCRWPLSFLADSSPSSEFSDSLVHSVFFLCMAFSKPFPLQPSIALILLCKPPLSKWLFIFSQG